MRSHNPLSLLRSVNLMDGCLFVIMSHHDLLLQHDEVLVPGNCHFTFPGKHHAVLFNSHQPFPQTKMRLAEIAFNFSFFPCRIVYFPLSLTMATVNDLLGKESSSACIGPTVTTGSASSPQSEAVTNELQELSLQPAPNSLPIHERKNGEVMIVITVSKRWNLREFLWHAVDNLHFAS